METYIRRCRWGQFILVRGDMISRYVEIYGEWGETEVDLFRALLPNDGVSVEVGSNIGMHAIAISKICSAGKVYCYEAQRHLYYILCGNIAMNNRLNVIARNLAVSDRRGHIDIQASDYDRPWNYGAFSIDAGFSEEGKFGGAIRTEKIEVVPLDKDPLLSKIEKIHLIKADVEGGEAKVVLGGKNLIERHRPYLFLEAGDEQSVGKLVEILSSIDYVGHWFISLRFRHDNFNSAPFNPRLSQKYDTNILFCPREKPLRNSDLPPVGNVYRIPKGMPILMAFPHPSGRRVEYTT
jgi:FkbM family methyltransferase